MTRPLFLWHDGVMQCLRVVAQLALAGAILTQSGHAQQGVTPPQSSSSKSHKLPRPIPLGRDESFQRDPLTHELYSPLKESSPADRGTIRSHVTLVQVACTVTAPDGTQVRGLDRNNFRLFEDNAPQEIESFDASATPASIALVIDASPSIFHELEQMRGAARALAENLSPRDEIAVVSFSEQAHLLLPFSTDHGLLDRAIDSKYLARVENSSQSNIYSSVFFSARELFYGRTGRKAIVLITDGQDSGLGLTWDPRSAETHSDEPSRLSFDDVARELGADGIALFIVSTENRPRAMTSDWLEAHRGEMLITSESQKQNMPHYTLYLAELARRTGGQLDFLRETGNLAEIYRRIALAISSQYTLGYYPAAGLARPGWRSLRVEFGSLANVPSGAKLFHRGSYYVSAFP